MNLTCASVSAFLSYTLEGTNCDARELNNLLKDDLIYKVRMRKEAAQRFVYNRFSIY